MFAPSPTRASRRKRFVILVLFAAALTLSGAQAQSDRSWVESAMERTLRLSAPWDLPLIPDATDGGPTGSSIPVDVKTPEGVQIVLDLPWGADTEVVKGPRQPEETALIIADELVDPWPDHEPILTTPASLNAPSETQSVSKEHVPRYPSSELVEPWLD